MTQEELQATLNRIEGIEIDYHLRDNAQIVIQLIDESYNGCWDYFYTTNATNRYWLREFKSSLKRYLKDNDNTILDIIVLIAYYHSFADAMPYGYWDCLNNEYCYCT